MTTRAAVARDRGTSGSERRPGRRRFSSTHLLIAAVAVLAFVLNFLALRSRDANVMVATADHSAPQGAALTEDLVALIPISTGFAGIDSLLAEDALADFDGWALARPVEEGDLITVDDLVEPGIAGGLRAMSLPVPPEHAAGGRLAVGDRVDVITVSQDVASYVATGLEVTAVPTPDSSTFSSATHHVVVGVTSDEALRLAEALDAGSIEVIRATGAPPLGEEVEADDS